MKMHLNNAKLLVLWYTLKNMNERDVNIEALDFYLL